ncbi:MAG: glycosyltransferase family 39 protein [Phycisphaerae bacterium]|nr:glycosyltransferase family 39 protein [Phycisphaerae bacterium]
MTTLSAGEIRAHETITTSSRSLSFWLLVSLCIFSALLARCCYMVRPFDSDGSMFIFMGRLITEGGRFCHEFSDNKFPTVGLITSVAWRAFGPVWRQYILLETAMSLLGACLLARMAGRRFGEHAVTPTLLYAIVHLNICFVVFGGFQLETLQMFFSILAAGAALELLDSGDWRDGITLGLATGCAMMLKPTGASVAIATLLTLLVFPSIADGKPAAGTRLIALRRASISMAIGVSLPAAVTLFYLIRSDNLHDMPALYRQISLYAKNSSWDAWDLIKPATVSILGGFPMLVRGGIFRRGRDRLNIPINRSATFFAMAWLALELFGVVAQRRMYAYHFMVMGPPMALLFGLLPRRDRLAPLAASLIPMCLFSIYGASLVIGLGYQGREHLEESDYLLTHTTSADSVWEDDAARLWLETGTQPGARYPLTFLFANYDSAGLEYGSQIIRDFEHRQPKYIVLRADFEPFLAHQGHEILELNRFAVRRENFVTAWRNIRSFVLANYVKETRIGREEIYRRRES